MDRTLIVPGGLKPTVFVDPQIFYLTLSGQIYLFGLISEYLQADRLMNL